MILQSPAFRGARSPARSRPSGLCSTCHRISVFTGIASSVGRVHDALVRARLTSVEAVELQEEAETSSAPHCRGWQTSDRQLPAGATGRPRPTARVLKNDLDAVAGIVGDDRVSIFMSFDSRLREQAEAMLNGILERAQAEPRTEFYLAVEPLSGPPLRDYPARIQRRPGSQTRIHDRRHHWGNGYATDAVRTMISFAWNVLDLHRITAAVGPQNAASLAVVKRVGMAYEGRLRDHVFTNGDWRDSLLCSLLHSDSAG